MNSRIDHAARQTRCAVRLLLSPVLLFTLVIGIGSVAVGVSVQGDPAALAEWLPRAIPWLLLVNHILLGAWLLPATEALSALFGDDVPPGEASSALASAMLPTAIVAVLLAPIVEEMLYRGVAWRLLTPRFGAAWTLLITALAFSFLHYAQGFWPMMYTSIAGLIYGGVRLWRGDIIAAMIVHLSFNVVELILLTW